MKFLELPSQAKALGPVERKYYPSGKSHLQWLFRCDCGGTATCPSSRVQQGHTASCGCLVKIVTAAMAKERNTTHGNSYSAEYKAWHAMKSRCAETKGRVAKDYADRGIKVCDRWANSFENFLADVGRKPSPQHSLDRFPNNDGPYEPGNVRWATREEQMLNTRQNVMVDALGERKPLAAFFPDGSKSPAYANACSRIRRGWDHERTVVMAMLGR